jgi:hypothetical protein
MSQYIKFILDRFGVSHIRKVTVLRNEQEWVNKQIVDEFKAVLHDIDIEVTRNVDLADCDLIVLPYDKDFLEEKPGGLELYGRLSSKKGTQVMLYGLRARRIEVIPADKLLSYFNRAQQVLFNYGLLRRLHLLDLVRRIYEWKKPS